MTDLPTIPARRCYECNALMTVPRTAMVEHTLGYGFEVVGLPLRCTGRLTIEGSGRKVNCDATDIIHVGLVEELQGEDADND